MNQGVAQFSSFQGPHFQEVFSKTPCEKHGTRNYYLLKTFKLPGDDKQHLLITVLSSPCSMTWNSVCVEHWHLAMFKLNGFYFFLFFPQTIVSFSS